MNSEHSPKYYLVESSIIPDIYIKVTKAKELLETGEASTVADAVHAVGISRSAYYKYKDFISPFTDLNRGNIITFHFQLRDKKGVLSAVLAIFAESGANILTINQSIPVNGTAPVTVSAQTESMQTSLDGFISNLRSTEGVLKIEVVAG